jgi:rhamnosyltransferase
MDIVPRQDAAATGQRLIGLGQLFRPRVPEPPEAGSGPVVAICHVHYPELLPEMLRALRWLPDGAALHLTSSRPEVFEAWRRLAPHLRVPTQLHPTENRGRDLRPFFECASRLALTDDTLVLKLHGKASTYTKQGDRWRGALIGGLLSRAQDVRVAARRFQSDPGLAMLGPPGSYISHPVYWGHNRESVVRFMREHFGSEPHESDLGFFAGTMFWIRGGFLKAFLPHVDLAAFAPEPLAQDGTYAHMIERTMAMAARVSGWGVAEIGVAGRMAPQNVASRKIEFL